MIGLRIVVRAILVFGVGVGEISFRVTILVEEGVEIRNINSMRRSKSIINISRIITTSSNRSNINRFNISSRSRNRSKIIISSSSMSNLGSNIRRNIRSNSSRNISSSSSNDISLIIYISRCILVTI